MPPIVKRNNYAKIGAMLKQMNNVLVSREVYIKGDGLVPIWAVRALKKMPGDASFQACRSALGATELEKCKIDRWDKFDDIRSDDEESLEERDKDEDFINGLAGFIDKEVGAESLTEDKRDALVLQITCFKYAEDRSFADLIFGMLPIVFRPIESSDLTTTEKVATKSVQLLDRWLATFIKIANDEDAKFAILDCLELLFLYGVGSAAAIGISIKTAAPNKDDLTPTPQYFRAAFPKVLFRLMLPESELEELPIDEWLEKRKEAVSISIQNKPPSIDLEFPSYGPT